MTSCSIMTPPGTLWPLFLRAVGRFSEAELGRHGVLADTSDKGPMKSRLYDILDRDDNGTINVKELRDAIRLSAHAELAIRLTPPPVPT